MIEAVVFSASFCFIFFSPLEAAAERKEKRPLRNPFTFIAVEVYNGRLSLLLLCNAELDTVWVAAASLSQGCEQCNMTVSDLEMTLLAMKLHFGGTLRALRDYFLCVVVKYCPSEAFGLYSDMKNG